MGMVKGAGGCSGRDLFYTAKQWDEDAGLYYFSARWYDPNTARFITEDPIRDGLLWYAYCNNNPLKFIDPTGLAKEDRLERRAKRQESRGNTSYAEELRAEASAIRERKQSERDKYTIDDSSYYHRDFTVDYFSNDTEQPISVTYNDQTFILGEDLDFGDVIPYDAVFDIPEGAQLGITTELGDVQFGFESSGSVYLPDSISAYNDLVSSDQAYRALRNNKIMGVGEATIGLGVMGASVYGLTLATTATEGLGAYQAGVAAAAGFQFGVGMFAFGTTRALGCPG